MRLIIQSRTLWTGVFSLLFFLAPFFCAFAAGLIVCEGNECRACDLKQVMWVLINFLIMLGSFVATLMFVWAGFEMVTASGNTAKIVKAKGTFKAVIIGVIIMLSGYLIVNAFMQVFVTGSFFSDRPWDYIECIPNPLFTQPAVTPGTPGTPGAPGTPGVAVTPGGSPASAQALQAAGVVVQGGVNVSQVSSDRIQQALTAAAQCSVANGGTETSNTCGVQISSGYRSGTAQSNHGNGTAIDISGRSTAFNSWMQSQQQAPSAFGGYPTVRAGGGACTYHPNESGGGYHWHCSENGR